jgi:hypothetical protein
MEVEETTEMTGGPVPPAPALDGNTGKQQLVNFELILL